MKDLGTLDKSGKLTGLDWSGKPAVARDMFGKPLPNFKNFDDVISHAKNPFDTYTKWGEGSHTPGDKGRGVFKRIGTEEGPFKRFFRGEGFGSKFGTGEGALSKIGEGAVKSAWQDSVPGKIIKAFGQTKKAGGPGFFKTLFPGAGGAAGTAAGTTAAGAGAGAAGAGAANTGLMAGMGPLGWTMLAGSLLGKLGLFKKHTLLGKIFSDERLKNNIITVGKSKKGIPIKEFGYNGLEGRYRGVISKDVPWAISKDNASGYDMVDYSKIDVPFERIK